MDETKPTLEDYARYFKVVGNPQKLAIVLILYAAEKLEEMETERTYESWRHFSELTGQGLTFGEEK